MAFAKVAYASAANGGAQSATTGGVTTTGADLLIAFVAFYNIGTPVLGDFTDNKSNTWTKRGNQVSGSGGSLTQYYCTPSSVGSGHTFTFASANTYMGLAVLAMSGSDTVTPFDQESAGSSPTGQTSTQPGSLTADTYLGVTGVSLDGSESGLTVNGSFTLETPVVAYGAGVNEAAGLAWKVFSAGAENPTWSGYGSCVSSSRMWTFKVGSGGGGGGKPTLYCAQQRQFRHEQQQRERLIERAYRETILRRAA